MSDKLHIECTVNGGCGSSDGMVEYEDGHAWCFACQKGKWPKDYKGLLNPAAEYRGIPPNVANFCGIRTYVDPESGQVVKREYPYEGDDCVKVRSHPKTFSVIGDNRKEITSRLFLKDKVFKDNRFVTIVEGEEDAAAHLAMMGNQATHSIHASSIIKCLSKKENYEHLMKFQEIIFVMDSDAAGEEALSKALTCLPLDKVRIVKLSPELKDPNGYLVAGKEKEYKNLWLNRSKWSPDNIISSQDDFAKLFEKGKSYSFVPTGIPALDDTMYGLTSSCLTLIKGEEGLGKTELLGYFEYGILKNTDVPIGIIHHEETPLRILQRFASYELGDAVHLPESKVSKEEQLEAIEKLGVKDRLYILDMRDVDTIDSVVDNIKYLVSVLGCKYVFMDPVNHTGDGGDGDVTRNLDYLAKKLGKLASEYDCGIVVTAHINDLGRVRDSKMFEKACYIRLELTRDITAEDPDVCNTTHIMCTKNRPWANTGKSGAVMFHRDSFTLEPVLTPLNF